MSFDHTSDQSGMMFCSLGLDTIQKVGFSCNNVD